MPAPRALMSVGFAIGVAFGSGCDGNQQSSSLCGDDRECGAREVCAFGLCLAPGDQRLTVVDVEVEAASLGLPMQNAFGVDLRTSPRVDVALAPGVTISGSVAVEGVGAGVDAVVVARPARFIPGRVLAPAAASSATAGFELVAVEGARYAMTVNPADPNTPPAYLFEPEGLEAEGGADRAQSLEPLLLSPGEIEVSGRVVAGAGVAAQGVPELEVALLDANGRRWSNAARTGQDGSFVLRLARAREGLALEITPRDNGGYPSVRIEALDVSADADLGEISLGVFSAPVRFAARVVDAVGAPALGARARFRAPIGAGVLSRTAEAGADGMLELLLPPGLYEATLVGAPDAPAAGLVIVSDIDVPAANTEVVFELVSRARWNGRVRDPEDGPLAGATLELARVGNLGEPAAALDVDLPIVASVTAGEDGSFAASVDPGTYRVIVRPPAGSKAPAFSELVEVPADRLARDVVLPPRALVAGTIVFDGSPVAGSYIRVFSSLVDERGAAILLGEGAAGPDGAFEIAVPDLVGESDRGQEP